VDRFLSLTVFSAVAKAGSFVGAARVLDMSPASVTEHVQRLERHLQTLLLQRTTRKVALTEQGQAFYEHAEKVLARLEEADTAMASHRGAAVGTLRVVMPPLLGTQVIIPRIPAFLRQNPELSIVTTLTTQVPDMVAQDWDLALQVRLTPEPGLAFVPLGLCRVRTLASPGYLALRGIPRTPNDLLQHDLIGVRDMPGDALALWRFQHEGRLISREFPTRLVTAAGDGQRAAALADGGIIQGVHYAVADLVESRRLVPVLEEWEWTGPPLGVLHVQGHALPPKAEVFVEFVKGLLRGRIAPYRSDWDAVRSME
jgi:DNA-binding transcriptional LysR family regulator